MISTFSHPRCSFRFAAKARGFAVPIAIATMLSVASPASAKGDAKPASPPATPSLEITYVANEGVLFSGAGHKVLIDAIFTEGFGRFVTPPPEILDKERNALPPFDHLDALLVTHYHPDHLNPAEVVQHLAHDREVILLGPPQVDGLLKPIDGYAAVAKQIVVVSPGSGAAVDSSVRDLVVRSVALPHMSDPQRKHQNLGFLLSLGGIKLFHVGDATASEVVEYKNLHLDGENISVALLSCFWFDDASVGAAREVIGYIKPKAIVMMHASAKQIAHYRDLVGKMNGLPPVYLVESPMETLRFRLTDGQLSADRASLQQRANLPPSKKP